MQVTSLHRKFHIMIVATEYVTTTYQWSNHLYCLNVQQNTNAGDAVFHFSFDCIHLWRLCILSSDSREEQNRLQQVSRVKGMG
jgi:hypothetical protein